MSPDDQRHGTYAGTQRHRKDGEKPCEPCRLAGNAYLREHRKVNPEDRRRTAARSRAMWRLVAMHRDEFNALFVVEVMRDKATT